ncbi:MAG UNVERIFIED_CONTAM: hypothetical protein LVR29_24095 [Microcystis novacekii LVE1205-3]
MLRFLPIVFALERTNQLSLLPDKDLVDLCHPIEPYQVTKNLIWDNLRHPHRRKTDGDSSPRHFFRVVASTGLTQIAEKRLIA